MRPNIYEVAVFIIFAILLAGALLSLLSLAEMSQCRSPLFPINLIAAWRGCGG